MSAPPPPAPPDDDNETVPDLSVQKLERIIEAVPEPKRDEFREIIREFMGIVHSKSSSPFDIDPEVAKILTEAQVKDNQNKFEFAKQRQHDNHEFKVMQHRDRFSMLRPIVFLVASVMTLCLFIGIALSYLGLTILGSCIMTAVITAVLGYLAGIGTADLVKGDK